MKRLIFTILILTSTFGFTQTNVALYDRGDAEVEGYIAHNGDMGSAVRKLFDGDREFESPAYGWLEAEPNKSSWVQINFKQEFTIDSVVIWYIQTTTAVEDAEIWFEHSYQINWPQWQRIKTVQELELTGHYLHDSSTSLTHVFEQPITTKEFKVIFYNFLGHPSSNFLAREIEVYANTGATGINDIEETPKTILRTYNLLGEVVPNDTKNQTIIVEYTDGSREKIHIVQ